MGVQGDRVFAAIKEKGFPDARKDPDDLLRETVSDLFEKKAANLATARRLLAEALTQYDQNGMWRVLDERAALLDIDDVSERWARGLVEHPFPISLLSLQFNWRYMKEHGVRAFYEMTARYVDELSANTRRWFDAWAAEAATGVVDRVTTVECDLASEEAPMHCDICKKTITALLYLNG
ncbi:hypothetical protein [Actinomadura sp. 9N215]|uniref:hypothetical protein n=1 Tax=Actinomadura sp. 9N215 TaxID=3375150 RepID=UPI00379304D4